MTLSLTGDQWKALGSKLFLLQAASTTKLPAAANTVAGGGLSAKLDFLKTNPLTQDFGIGVVDLTAGASSPVVWMNNESVAWRAGSTAKIAILLAAVQLRDDVRIAQSFVPNADLDALFASAKLWGMGKDSKLQQIAGNAHAPRISTIFDFSKAQAEFAGPDADTPNGTDITNHLNSATGGDGHLTWPLATDFDFSERLWLAGARSDNVAATSCISEIGVAYLKAVQRAYGLFDPPNGLKLLLAGPYTSRVDTSVPVSNASSAIKYRALKDVEMPRVTDAIKSASGAFDDQFSWESTSALALITYLIALMQDGLVAFNHGLSFGTVGCTTIRANLSPGGANVTQSHIAKGVATVTNVTKQLTKIGLLGLADKEPGPLNCEFAYLETKENSAIPPSTSPKVMKYGVLVTGIRSKNNPDGTPGPHAAAVTRAVGAAIHQALVAP
jgi:hypothetical protein